MSRHSCISMLLEANVDALAKERLGGLTARQELVNTYPALRTRHERSAIAAASAAPSPPAAVQTRPRSLSPNSKREEADLRAAERCFLLLAEHDAPPPPTPPPTPPPAEPEIPAELLGEKLLDAIVGRKVLEALHRKLDQVRARRQPRHHHHHHHQQQQHHLITR